MRGFGCTLYWKNKNGDLEKFSGKACYSGLNGDSIFVNDLSKISSDILKEKMLKNSELCRISFFNRNPLASYYIDIKELSDTPDLIYIEDYVQEETKEHIEDLINIINEISHCKLVTINDKQYIEFKLLKTYDQSLILLNFIRNLWYDGSDSSCTYTKTFFENYKVKEYDDPLKNLLLANKIACKKANIKMPLGHSNTQLADDLVIRSTEELLEYKGSTTAGFLK